MGESVLGNVRIVRIALIVAGVALGALAAASTWAGFDPHALAVEVGGATTSAVLACACWLRVSGRDDGRRELVRELVEVYLDEREPTRPALRQLL